LQCVVAKKVQISASRNTFLWPKKLGPEFFEKRDRHSPSSLRGAWVGSGEQVVRGVVVVVVVVAVVVVELVVGLCSLWWVVGVGVALTSAATMGVRKDAAV